MKVQRHFNLQPTLAGDIVALRPLRAQDFEALFAAAADPLIWEQHPEHTRYRRDVFTSFFATALASGGALLATEQATGEVIGTSRYYDWNPDAQSVAIGYTFLVRRHWGGRTNRELKQLMIGHAFRHVRTVWFHVGRDNRRSRAALERIGARLDDGSAPGQVEAAQEKVFYRIDAPGHAAASTSEVKS
jgi:RimJ/RimL family protein N-acetyltransferase